MAVCGAADVLIAPCDPGDERYRRWVAATARTLSPDPADRKAGTDTLRALGFAVHAAAEAPAAASQNRRRFGWWGPQMTVAALAAVSVWAAYHDGQGRELCGLPTKRGGRCRNLKAGCPDRAAGRHTSKHSALLSDALQYDAPSLSAARAAARQADWVNPPKTRPRGALRAGRALAAGEAGVMPSGTPPIEALAQQIADFLDKQPDGFTFDPAAPHNPETDPGPQAGVCVTLDNTKLQWTAEEARGLFDDAGEASTGEEMIDGWVNTVSEILKDGRCWVGGWRDSAGAVEINVTFVFKPEHELAAREFGALQGQRAVHRLEDHTDLDTCGSGGVGAEHAAAAQDSVDARTGQRQRRSRRVSGRRPRA